MAFSKRQKKWFKWLVILLSIPVLAFLIYYYVAEKRFKDIIKYVVEKESNGAYTFNATTIKLSIRNRTVFIQDAKLISTDSNYASPYYDVKIPQIYLSIQSWMQLIFKGQLLVDSLSIALPSLRKHDRTENENKSNTQVRFQFSKVAQMLEKTMERLQVRSFSLQNGSFDYRNKKSRLPFISNRINLSLKNFKKTDSTDTRLLNSDDLDIDIQNQYWYLPDGLHEISFQKLHFSGRNQFFELDSCFFRAKDSIGGSIILSAERIFFNSNQLWASYVNEELIIDTVVLYRPVIDIHAPQKKKTIDSTKLTEKQLDKTVHELFKELRFKYIDVQEGEIIFNESTVGTTAGPRQRTNLRIYNMAIDPKVSQITTDSIHMLLNNTRFVTKDGMFQLNIGEFTLHNKNVLLSNIEFGPTALNHSLKGMTFKAPTLSLENITLDDLLNKRLKGSSAHLIRPEISLFDKRKSRTEKVTTDKNAGNMDQFFRTLHGLSELISVDNFNVVGGNMKFRSSAGAAPMAIDMKNVQLTLLLNKFFVSDSLIDIKRSMPLFKIQEVNLNSGSLSIKFHNYSFIGLSRHNQASDLTLSTGRGLVLKGTDLYWEILDWDMLQKHKIIQTEYIKMGMLDISITGEKEKKAVKKAPKDLPIINIARLELQKIRFNKNNDSKNSSMHFVANDLCVSGIGSKEHFLTWEEAIGTISNISVKNPNMNTSIEKITFYNQFETVLQNTAVNITNEKGSTQLNLPITTLKMNVRSTDFSSINANTIVLNNPVVKILNKGDSSKSSVPKNESTGLPVVLDIDNLAVNNAALEYITEKSTDTVKVNTIININAKNLHTYKKQEKLVDYDKVEISVTDAHMHKKNTELSAPSSSLVLTKGLVQKNNNQPIAFTSGLLFKWNDLKFENKKTDSTGLAIEKISGSLIDSTFSFSPKEKLKWTALMNNASITEGAVTYRGKDITAKVGSLTWNENPKTLSLHSFSVMPKLSKEESFQKAEWQKDYMTIEGEAIHISGINIRQEPNDSTLEINKVVVDRIDLSTTRDKRIPFKHGVQKSMPTILISAIKKPIKVDSVIIQHSNVTINEISNKTNKQGTIPLQDINAVLTNVSNDPDNKDSLTIVANAKILDHYIRYLRYSEVYGDSLSNFYMNVNVSPLPLPALSEITVPLASVRIDRGNSDTLYASWVGNKHAAIGQMDFYYKDLKVRLLDKDDPEKNSFKLKLINSLANGLIIHKKNNESSVIFFERDKEKFVFNYWIKTVFGGLGTSAGVKKDKKALKQYNKVKKEYSLPENPFQ